jgi:long-chain acyl-CoA synthetase
MDTGPINMQEVRPTIVISVPRLYEKMYARVLENAMAGSGLKKRIFFWARRVAERWADVRLAGGTPRGLLAMQYALAQKLVFSKLKARTGGRLRFFVSGGAPLAPDINKFFYAAGLTILEGYGLTETSPVIGVNTPEQFRLGTIGRAIPSVEVKIAPDGEILTRGPHVMKGYYKNPEATRETIDGERWLHTGDIGVIDPDGFLQITDRKKDIIVLSGGDNVAPQRVEGVLALQPEIGQVIVYGDGQPHLVALIVPDAEFAKGYARRHKLPSDLDELVQHQDFERAIGEAVTRANESLSVIERVRHFRLMAAAFTVENGTMTPTLKLKRPLIYRLHKELFEGMYQHHDSARVAARGG